MKKSVVLLILSTILIVPIFGAQVSFARDCELLQSFPKELELCQRYQALKLGYSNHGLNIEDISFYKALRVLTPRDYEASGYLPWKAYEPAPLTWVYWERGNAIIKALNSKMEAFRQGNVQFEITKELLSKIHLSTMPASLLGKVPGVVNSASMSLKVIPKPGQLRNTSFNVFPPGFSTNKLESSQIEAIQELRGEDGRPYIAIDPSQTYVFYLATERVDAELGALLKDLNQGLAKFENRTSTESPIGFASRVQRKYVAIHPFHEGQGRMSRWIQDLIFLRLGLPFITGGSLQEDVTTRSGHYEVATEAALNQTLSQLQLCLNPFEMVPEQCVSLYDYNTNPYQGKSLEVLLTDDEKVEQSKTIVFSQIDSFKKLSDLPINGIGARRRMAKALAHVPGDIRARFKSLLSDTDSLVRADLLQFILSYRGNEDYNIILDAIESTHSDVRTAGLKALALYQGKNAIELFKQGFLRCNCNEMWDALLNYRGEDTPLVFEALGKANYLFKMSNPRAREFFAKYHGVYAPQVFLKLLYIDSIFNDVHQVIEEALRNNTTGVVTSIFKELLISKGYLPFNSLDGYNGSDAPQVFEELLRYFDGKARKAVLSSLKKFHGASEVAVFEMAANHPDLKVAKTVLFALDDSFNMSYVNDNRVPVFTAALSSPHALVRTKAASLIKHKIFTRADLKTGSQATLQMVDFGIQYLAPKDLMEGIGNYSGSMAPEIYQKLFHSENEAIRLAAVRSLGYRRTHDQRDIFERLLDYKQPRRTRLQVIDSLAYTSVDSKFYLVSLQDPDESIRDRAASTFFQCNYFAAKDVFRWAYGLKDSQIRARAIVGLSSCNGPYAELVLQEALTAKYEDVNKAAASALGRYDGDQVSQFKFYKLAFENVHLSVQEQARESLRRSRKDLEILGILYARKGFLRENAIKVYGLLITDKVPGILVDLYGPDKDRQTRVREILDDIKRVNAECASLGRSDEATLTTESIDRLLDPNELLFAFERLSIEDRPRFVDGVLRDYLKFDRDLLDRFFERILLEKTSVVYVSAFYKYLGIHKDSYRLFAMGLMSLSIQKTSMILMLPSYVGKDAHKLFEFVLSNSSIFSEEDVEFLFIMLKSKATLRPTLSMLLDLFRSSNVRIRKASLVAIKEVYPDIFSFTHPLLISYFNSSLEDTIESFMSSDVLESIQSEFKKIDLEMVSN